MESAGHTLKMTWPLMKKEIYHCNLFLFWKHFGFLRNEAFLGKNKISIGGIHERLELTKQCSALLNFHFMCYLVKNSRRSLPRLLGGETLSLKAERDLVSGSSWSPGGTWVPPGLHPHCGSAVSAHCLVKYWRKNFLAAGAT